MTGVDLPQTFHEVEKEVGLLSELQRILLGTDGSVTTLLEIITGSPVDVTTILQEVIGADEALARDLDVNVGDKVNHRIVELKNHSVHLLKWLEKYGNLRAF
jgi:beta-ribofuranosylaminobenzene 5'-phosphate synthase